MYTPTVPIFVFNGKCAFCAYWVSLSKKRTGDAVEYLPFQEVLDRFPEVSETSFRKAVKLRTPDGKTYSGANATFRALAYNPRYRFLVTLYKYLPGFAVVAELGYTLVSKNRDKVYYFVRKLNHINHD